MSKIKLLGRIGNGYITDPLSQNFIIYFASYILSALLSSVPFLGLLASPTGNTANDTLTWGAFLLAFADCVVPTTVTLTAGTAIQNIAKSQESHIGLRVSTIWSAVLTLVYMLLYTALRQQGFAWLAWAAIFGALLISFLNLWTVSQIENEALRGVVTAPSDH